MRSKVKAASIALPLSFLALAFGLVSCASASNPAAVSTASPTSTATRTPASPTSTAALAPALSSEVQGKAFSISLPAGWTVQSQDDYAGGGASAPAAGNFGNTTLLEESPGILIAIDEHKPAPVDLTTYCQDLAANGATIAGLPMKHDTNTAPGKDGWSFVNKSNVLYDIVIVSGNSNIDQTQRALFMQVLATFKPLDSSSACA